MYNYLYSRPLWLVALVIIGSIALWSWFGSTLSTKSAASRRIWTAVNCILLFLSLCAILFITLFRRSVGVQTIDLHPFHSFAAAREQPEIYREMVMNIFLFVPFGLTLSQILPRKWPRLGKIFIILLFGFVLSVIIEWTQYHFGLGTAETDDVICNTIGTFLGSLPLLLNVKM